MSDNGVSLDANITNIHYSNLTPRIGIVLSITIPKRVDTKAEQNPEQNLP